MTQENLILDTEHLKKVEDSVLFYPCSGDDWQVPVTLFSPYVTDFWFADKAYFLSSCRSGFSAPADMQQPLLAKNKRYIFLGKEISGPPEWPSGNPDIEPCILTETYRHIQTGREVNIHRRRGYGFSAFEKEIEEVGVFFYRGDSMGDGGSGNMWLKKERLDKMLDKMLDFGLIVSDGSDGTLRTRKTGTYKEMSKYTNKKLTINPNKIVGEMQSFTDRKGRVFQCVGYAGEKYGPTMIWQIRKNIY